MKRIINEVLLRKHIVAQYGETMADVMLGFQVDAVRKIAALYDDMLEARAAAQADLKALKAAQPSLEPLRREMDARYTAWVEACNALEAQRIRNEVAETKVRQKISDLNTRLSALIANSRDEGWLKTDWSQPDVYTEGLMEQSLRRDQANPEARH